MATVVNFIDTSLQAAAARSVNLPTADIQLLPSAPLFKVAPDGSITPASITFTATLIDLDAELTFNATGAPLTSVTARSVTVIGESMTGSSVTVIASATVNGRTYTKPCTVSKVQDGSVGSTTYTWIKYGDSAVGAGLSDDPTGKAYIGLAYNKPSPNESVIASDYTWSLIKGEDGQPGPKGNDGAQLYTWIKYSDSADGAGLYDVPTANTLYIGIAVNKTTPTESTSKTDYVWSRFKGDQGVPGPALYTWIKYADSAAGAGLSDDPTGKAYIGFAYNKTTAVESDNPADYTWSLNQGGQGVPGQPGKDGQTLYTWVKYSDVPDGTGLYDVPTASTMYIGIAVNKVTATESTSKADYTWSKFRGDQGVPGNPGQPGQRGTVDISAGTAGAVWSDSEATAAIAQTGYGVPQMLDVVTLYNQAAGFANTRYWNGSAWIPVSQVINGALLVKGTVAAEAVDTRGLNVKDLQGKVIVGIGSALDPAYAAPGTLNSGVSMSTTGQLLGAGGGQVQTLPVTDGARTVDYAPRDYGIVHVKEFKQCSSIGISSATAYCVLETMKPWIDNSGGNATQWAYISASEVWKRSGGCGDASWGAWVRDLDRNLYTGDLNATEGANASNLKATIGGDNLTYNSSFEKMTSGIADGFSIYGGPGTGTETAGEDTYGAAGSGRVGGVAQVVVWSNSHTGPKGIFGTVCKQGWEPGRTYVLSVYAKTANISSASGLRLNWNTAPAATLARKNPALTTSWQRYEFLLTWGGAVEASGRAIISVEYGAGAGNVLFDDMMVVEGDVLPAYYPSAKEAGTTADWSGVNGPNKPQDNATVGAPSGTMVGGTDAGLVASRALNGDSAYNALPGITSSISDKISKTAGGLLSAPVVIQTGGGVVVGDMTYDPSTGLRSGGRGVATTPYGLVAHNGEKYTVVIDARDGNAYFSGQLQAGTTMSQSISALSAQIGLLRTSASGERTEIADNVIKMFASNNQKILHLGDSTK